MFNTHSGDITDKNLPEETAPQSLAVVAEPERSFYELASKPDDLSDSFYDSEYIQTETQNKMESYISRIQSPEDLEDVTLVQWTRGANRIYDADGDGVEDNIKRTYEELDRFYYPAVFGEAEDIHNTHHGNLPGHVQREFDLMEKEPVDHYTLIAADWTRK